MINCMLIVFNLLIIAFLKGICIGAYAHTPIYTLPVDTFVTFENNGAIVKYCAPLHKNEDWKNWKAVCAHLDFSKKFLDSGSTHVLGTKAYMRQTPPFWEYLVNTAGLAPSRGHLLAKRLGGNGHYVLNIVAQNLRTNSVDMNAIEALISNAYKERIKIHPNCRIEYFVYTHYEQINPLATIFIKSWIYGWQENKYLRYPWVFYGLENQNVKTYFKSEVSSLQQKNC